jgi:hypothetical protein
LGGYQVKGAKRTDEDAAREANFAAFASKNPEMPVADLKTAAFKEFGYTPQQWEKTVTSRLNIDTAEMGLFKKGIQSKLKGKNLSQLGELYNSDPDFDDKTDLAIVPGKGGAVTLNFIDKATKKITSTASFKNEALATEYLNKQAVEPENLGSWMLNLKKVEAAIDASAASAAKDRAMGGLYAAGGKDANKLSSTDALVKTAEGLVTKGTYKDLPTAIEALKKGSARDADAESWLKIEQDLVGKMATPDEINTQRMAFFVRRGYAPPAVKATLEAGVNPTTGKRLTKSDVDAYNATYPQTPVDPSTLRWLDSPEREARRQGLINQIPK